MVWEYNRRDRGIAELTRLMRLYVWHYNPKSGSFAGIPVAPTIEELELNWANPSSLSGLPVLPRLRRLGIARCRNGADK